MCASYIVPTKWKSGSQTNTCIKSFIVSCDLKNIFKQILYKNDNIFLNEVKALVSCNSHKKFMTKTQRKSLSC